jgi:hypothetical protein
MTVWRCLAKRLGQHMRQAMDVRDVEVIMFSSFSLFECLYLVIEVSDSKDLKRTMVLQVILIVNMFAFPRATHSVDNVFTPLECP